MFETLKIIAVIVWILLILSILIQNKSVSLNLSTMSGGMDAVKKRGPEKIMQNATIILAVVFVGTSLALFLLSQ